MSIIKELRFDIFRVNVAARNQQGAFEELAQAAAPLCGLNRLALMDVFERRLLERTFGMGDGVAVFDVVSPRIQTPVLALFTFAHDIDFNALDGEPANIMAAVLSPSSADSAHLQRLAVVSRVLRSCDLCAALRDAEDLDTMRALFMPTQDWMIAA